MSSLSFRPCIICGNFSHQTDGLHIRVCVFAKILDLHFTAEATGRIYNMKQHLTHVLQIANFFEKLD